MRGDLDFCAPLPLPGESLIDHIRRIAGEQAASDNNGFGARSGTPLVSGKRRNPYPTRARDEKAKLETGFPKRAANRGTFTEAYNYA